MEGTKEIKFTVRMPQVGDTLPLDAVWDESGVIGHYCQYSGDLKWPDGSLAEYSDAAMLGIPDAVYFNSDKIYEVPNARVPAWKWSN